MRNVVELDGILSQRYDGPIAQREGARGKMFSYVPWTVTKRLLDEVFGPFGWTTTPPHSYFANGTYNVEFGLTVRAEGVDGNVIEKTVPCSGQANARSEGDDNALKSAQSDALSRGAKLLGDRFGFFLYEKEETAPAPAARRSDSAAAPSRPRAASGDGLGSRPTQGQLRFAASLGYSAEEFNAMPFSEWKAILDEKIQKAGTESSRKPYGSRAARAPQVDDGGEGDDLPF